MWVLHLQGGCRADFVLAQHGGSRMYTISDDWVIGDGIMASPLRPLLLPDLCAMSCLVLSCHILSVSLPALGALTQCRSAGDSSAVPCMSQSANAVPASMPHAASLQRPCHMLQQ